MPIDLNNQPEEVAPDRCPLCGGPNHCVLVPGGGTHADCWCAGVHFPKSLLARIPVKAQNRACVCRQCYESAKAEEDDPRPN